MFRLSVLVMSVLFVFNATASSKSMCEKIEVDMFKAYSEMSEAQANLKEAENQSASDMAHTFSEAYTVISQSHGTISIATIDKINLNCYEFFNLTDTETCEESLANLSESHTAASFAALDVSEAYATASKVDAAVDAATSKKDLSKKLQADLSKSAADINKATDELNEAVDNIIQSKDNYAKNCKYKNS